MYIKRTEQNVDIQQKKIGTVSRMLSLLSKENFFYVSNFSTVLDSVQ